MPPAVQGTGDIYDANGTLVVAGAKMASGAAGNVLTTDANGNLSSQALTPSQLAPASPAPSKYAPLLYGAVWGYPYKFYPDNYGAKGTGTVVTDAAMTSAGGTALACTSSSPFSAGSVGKSIMVSGAGGTYTPKNGTITGYTDAAHVACSFAATANTGGTPGTIGYFGDDDTAALQAQLNAAYAYVQAHGYAEFLLDPSLVYIAGGPFNVNTGNSLLGNSQIGLPNAAMTSMTGELAFLGGGSAAPLMSWLELFPSAPGGIIASTRTDGTNNATYGPASVIGGPFSGMGGEPGTFSNICIRVAGLGILVPYNVNVIGLDLFSMIEADVESFSGFAAGVVPASSAPSPSLATPGNLTAAFSAALRMPCAGNQVVCRGGQLRGEGWIYGGLLSEWSHWQDAHFMYSVGAAGIYSGNGVSMVHHAVIDHMQAENCTNALIQVDNGTKRIRASIGTESISSASHVFDPSNLISGDIDFYPQGGAGTYSNWANGHGINLRMRNMMTVPGTLGPPAVPLTTVPLFNYYGRNATVYITSGGAAVTAITVTTPGGTVIQTGQTLGTTGTVAVWVPIGYSITLTYASTAPAWVWQGD